MAIKRGDVVSHSGAAEWGVGKVVEVGDTRASIHFNDGIVRKISSSHFASLQPAPPASFMPLVPPEQKAAPKAPKAPKTLKATSARQKKA